jgi:predicted DNA binding CopG/RHH family protein
MTDPKDNTSAWDTGQLGRDMNHAQAVPAAALAAIDESTGMQLISIRLPRTLISMLKLIAEYHGISYQPMVRDLLTRFAVSEVNSIMEIKAKELAALQTSEEDGPVTDFLRRQA